tara:strand:+ start:128 stop:298 length:171 start_codon:yes stop_codon:yes gene_type:complete
MTRQQEDTMYEIYMEVEKLGLRKKFDKQMEKMSTQSKHKWKDICEKQEHALRRIKE